MQRVKMKAYLEVVGTPDLEVGHPRIPPELGVQGVTPFLTPRLLPTRPAHTHRALLQQTAAPWGHTAVH